MAIPLPSSCEGCPFYKYKDDPNNGFVPDTVVKNSKVYFLAQNPGRDEVSGRRLVKRHFYGGGNYSDEFVQQNPAPLIGATGQQFTTRYLPLTGLKRSEVSLGNAIRCRPGAAIAKEKNTAGKPDDLPMLTSKMRLEDSKSDIVNALKHCREAHFHPPRSVQLVVAMGQYAMFVMTGLHREDNEFDDHRRKPSALESWRGYGVDADFTRIRTIDTGYYHNLYSPQIVFITLHISALNYGNNKRFIHAVLQDFYKIKRLLNGDWPKVMPTWYRMPPDTWPKYAAFDTEYNPKTNELYRWSMCSSEGELYCVEADRSSVIPVQPGSTVIIQNELADFRHLKGLIDVESIKIEDLMIAHSTLWTGEPHSLNYINSMYGQLNRYKHLSTDNSLFYSAADSWEPMNIWRNELLPQFRADKQSWEVYKRYRLPLARIINKAQETGVMIDSTRLGEVRDILISRIEGYKDRAREITGDDKFELGGMKQMREVMYG